MLTARPWTPKPSRVPSQSLPPATSAMPWVPSGSWTTPIAGVRAAAGRSGAGGAPSLTSRRSVAASAAPATTTAATAAAAARSHRLRRDAAAPEGVEGGALGASAALLGGLGQARERPAQAILEAGHPPSPSSSRSSASARPSREFTVPTGMSRISAISGGV